MQAGEMWAKETCKDAGRGASGREGITERGKHMEAKGQAMNMRQGGSKSTMKAEKCRMQANKQG